MHLHDNRNDDLAQPAYSPRNGSKLPSPEAIARNERIKSLNDALRVHGRGGMVLMTNGIASHDRDTVQAIFAGVAAFDSFNADNDPWCEHDCALLAVRDISVMFKIDYFDKARAFHSPNPADPSVTTRVMTVMLADEY